MAKDDKKLEWGNARVEVTALMPEIDIFLADNHSRTTIFKMLKDQGKLSCGFSTFCRWVDRLSDEHPRPAKKSLPSVQEPADQSPPIKKETSPSSEEKKGKNVLRVIRKKQKRYEN
jgi:hypothetical protein